VRSQKKRLRANKSGRWAAYKQWSESPRNQSGRQGKGLWRKGLAEEL